MAYIALPVRIDK